MTGGTTATARPGPSATPANGSTGPVLLSLFLVGTVLCGAAMLLTPTAQFAAAGLAACTIVTVPTARRGYDLLSPWTLLVVVVYLGCGARGLVLSLGWEGSSRSLDELFLLGHGPGYFARPSLWYLISLALMTVVFLATTSERRRPGRQTVGMKRTYRFHSFTPEICLLMSGVGVLAFLLYVRQTGGLDLASISTKRSGATTVQAEGVLRALNGFSAASLWIYTAYAFGRGPVRLVSKQGAFFLLLTCMAVVMPFYASTRTDTIFILLVAIAIAYASPNSRRVRWRFIRNLVILMLVLAASMTYLRSASRDTSEPTVGGYREALLEATVINRNLGDMETTAHVMHAVPGLLPFADGATITTYLAAPIPRSIWPSKPVIAPGPTLGRVIYGLNRAGVPPGFVAEMYWNFGYSGILLGSVLLGWLLGAVHRRFTRGARREAAVTVLYAAVPMRIGGYIMAFGVGTGIFNILVDSIPVLIGLVLCGRFSARAAEQEPAESASHA